MTCPIDLLEVVALTEDLPDRGLCRGQVGVSRKTPSEITRVADRRGRIEPAGKDQALFRLSRWLSRW